jgi:hypothetical protein
MPAAVCIVTLHVRLEFRSAGVVLLDWFASELVRSVNGLDGEIPSVSSVGPICILY